MCKSENSIRSESHICLQLWKTLFCGGSGDVGMDINRDWERIRRGRLQPQSWCSINLGLKSI